MVQICFLINKIRSDLLVFIFLGDKREKNISDVQRPSLQHESAVLVLLFKLTSVAAGVERLKTKINQKNKEGVYFCFFEVAFYK